MTLRRVITIVAAVAAVTALVGSAVAYANAGDDDAAGDTAGAADGAVAADHGGHRDGPDEDDEPGGHARHRHPRLPAYDERYEAAGAGERAAAADLLDEVTATLATYADVDAAVAAGYLAPRRPHSARHHYLNPSLVRDADVLDPRHPEGLVYHEVEGREPVLLGAFFVAPRGAEAPRPAGDLVVWHSHDPACPDFFATADAPCTDVRRMLHVWTADTVTMTARRDPQRSAEVRFVDPFGAPFRAVVEPVRPGPSSGGS
jgi:hypothetical protein